MKMKKWQFKYKLIGLVVILLAVIIGTAFVLSGYNKYFINNEYLKGRVFIPPIVCVDDIQCDLYSQGCTVGVCQKQGGSLEGKCTAQRRSCGADPNNLNSCEAGTCVEWASAFEEVSWGCDYTGTECDPSDACKDSLGCERPADGGPGVCKYEPKCPSLGACEAGYCDPEDGCIYFPVDCSDGDPCTIDSCDQVSGACINRRTDLCEDYCREVEDCNDNDDCTLDICDGSVCVYRPMGGPFCTNETPPPASPSPGVTPAGTPGAGGCVSNEECKSADSCKFGYCNTAVGVCQYVQNPDPNCVGMPGTEPKQSWESTDI